ncbi:MAG: hypothetical protein KC620_10750, partial [Myxococcales bacterium]|nr:hypothetical protein [Myxococcales bacterium]
PCCHVGRPTVAGIAYALTTAEGERTMTPPPTADQATATATEIDARTDPAGWLAARPNPLDLTAERWDLKGKGGIERWFPIGAGMALVLASKALLPKSRILDDWQAWMEPVAALMIVGVVLIAALRASRTAYRIDTRGWRIWRQRTIAGINLPPTHFSPDQLALTVGSARRFSQGAESWISEILLTTTKGDVITLVDAISGPAEMVQPVAEWLAERMGLPFVPTTPGRQIDTLARSTDGSSTLVTRDLPPVRKRFLLAMALVILVGVLIIVGVIIAA